MFIGAVFHKGRLNLSIKGNQKQTTILIFAKSHQFIWHTNLRGRGWPTIR